MDIMFYIIMIIFIIIYLLLEGRSNILYSIQRSLSIVVVDRWTLWA